MIDFLKEIESLEKQRNEIMIFTMSLLSFLIIAFGFLLSYYGGGILFWLWCGDWLFCSIIYIEIIERKRRYQNAKRTTNEYY